jgi:hypothetical protein
MKLKSNRQRWTPERSEAEIKIPYFEPIKHVETKSPENDFEPNDAKAGIAQPKVSDSRGSGSNSTARYS